LRTLSFQQIIRRLLEQIISGTQVLKNSINKLGLLPRIVQAFLQVLNTLEVDDLTRFQSLVIFQTCCAELLLSLSFGVRMGGGGPTVL
jgi:hypothetical protein